MRYSRESICVEFTLEDAALADANALPQKQRARRPAPLQKLKTAYGRSESGQIRLDMIVTGLYPGTLAVRTLYFSCECERSLA